MLSKSLLIHKEKIRNFVGMTIISKSSGVLGFSIDGLKIPNQTIYYAIKFFLKMYSVLSLL